MEKKKTTFSFPYFYRLMDKVNQYNVISKHISEIQFTHIYFFWYTFYIKESLILIKYFFFCLIVPIIFFIIFIIP